MLEMNYKMHNSGQYLLDSSSSYGFYLFSSFVFSHCFIFLTGKKNKPVDLIKNKLPKSNSKIKFRIQLIFAYPGYSVARFLLPDTVREVN